MSAIYHNQRVVARTSRVVSGQSEYARHSRGLLAMLLVLMLFVALAAVMYNNAYPELNLVLAVGVVAALCIVRWPVVGTYLAIILTVLFDGFPNAFVKTWVSEMGVFRNLSYKGLPQYVYISLFELVIILTLACVIMRRFNAHAKLERGPLYRLVLAFGAIVAVGVLNGLSTGGDFKITLWEARPLFYMVLLYIVAVNTISKPLHIRVVLWVTALATLGRCLEGFFRYFTIPKDIRAVVPVLLEHDDSLFLVIGVGLLVAATLWRKWLPRWLYPVLWVLLPLSLLMMVINGRRAVFLCVAIALMAFIPLLWASMRSKQQRKWLLVILVALGIAGVAYLGAFWNKEGGIAQPAAAVRSLFQPSERDYLSNLYRDQENTNLRYTIGFSPVIGIGFGKPFSIIEPMVDLTKEWAFQLYMPHNNMLWLWLRMGVIGFVIFWVTIGAAIMLVTACLRLGVAHLRLLADEGQAELNVPKETRPDQQRNVFSRSLSLYRMQVRVTEDVVPTTKISEKGMNRRLRNRELRECAEFLVFAMLVLATLVSLVGLGVVDQGLMSFRLSAFAGAMMGGLSAAWTMYNAKYRVPAEYIKPDGSSPILDKLPEQEGKPDVQRRRVRALVTI